MEISELIEKIDIVEYISQYIDLEQRGDEWWGLSCFKDEKTPSFSVRKDPPVFFDYSSGIGGNLFTFVRYYERCGSKMAVEILKKYAGVEGDVEIVDRNMSATAVCKKFRPPKKTEKAEANAVLDDDVMAMYENRPDKLSVWEDEGISMDTLKRWQVKYDAFSDRIVYPIRDMSGKIVNIGGRTLEPRWKEMNMRKYSYFYKWGTLRTIFGAYENMDNIIEKKEIILFEGCKSVLIADTWGIKNTGAILTSHLNPHQMKILAGLGCRVVFALDKDVDITQDHNINRLKNYVRVEYLFDRDGLLDQKDAPVDRGIEVFNKLYERRLRL